MNHIVRDSTRCGDDWCDAKQSLLKQQEISKRLVEQVALLREALLAWATLIEFQYTGSKEAMTHLQICDNIGQEALEATK